MSWEVFRLSSVQGSRGTVNEGIMGNCSDPEPCVVT